MAAMDLHGLPLYGCESVPRRGLLSLVYCVLYK